jgi:hypothetical protein
MIVSVREHPKTFRNVLEPVRPGGFRAMKATVIKFGASGEIAVFKACLKQFEQFEQPAIFPEDTGCSNRSIAF